MATEEERFLTAVESWNAAHADAGLSITVLHLMNMNGHPVAWIRAMQLDNPARPDGNKGYSHCLMCDHHLQDQDFNPRGWPPPDCPMHKSACLQRQLELHTELVEIPEVINADGIFDFQLNRWALILVAVLQRMANHEYVGVPGISLSSLDIQRLIFGDEIDNFSLDELLKVIKPRLYQFEGKKVAPRSPGISEIARIGNSAAAVYEGGK